MNRFAFSLNLVRPYIEGENIKNGDGCIGVDTPRGEQQKHLAVSGELAFECGAVISGGFSGSGTYACYTDEYIHNQRNISANDDSAGVTVVYDVTARSDVLLVGGASLGLSLTVGQLA